jgi:hypothetical protein
MQMLALSLHLNNAPPKTASLFVVALTDAGGRMRNEGKLPNLGCFAYKPSCTPNHKKIAPPKNSDDARVLKERSGREKSRVVASIWYAATTDAGRRKEVI